MERGTRCPRCKRDALCLQVKAACPWPENTPLGTRTFLRPGTVLALDPQMCIPEERLYVRVEDTVVITEEEAENLTGDSPLELAGVEALMKEPGLLDRFPAQG